MSAKATRVVVADDSALMRRIVSNSLGRAGVTVVGSAANGDEALAVCERERPDALTLDLAMPGLDGLGVLRALRTRTGPQLPVVVVSAFDPAKGARAVDALAEGAFDLVAKPAIGESLDEFAGRLITKVRAAAQSRAKGSAATAPAPKRREHRVLRIGVSRVVLIATSTGGPRALATLLPKLPAPLGAGTMIVQHMPPGFTSSLAARLDRASTLTVCEAVGGEALNPAVALLAPGGKHLRLDEQGRTSLSDEAEVGGLRPRADLLISDAARVFGRRLVLVVMTGMGNDGLAGAAEVRRRGGRILVEAPESCTVYGMPRAIAEADLADDILPLDHLAAAVIAEARG
jgi:two-component system chemotaxis response regulator CheB